MNGVNKQNLPEKICPHCQRPFVWRKKWARDWENVRYCSDACRRGKKWWNHDRRSRHSCGHHLGPARADLDEDKLVAHNRLDRSRRLPGHAPH